MAKGKPFGGKQGSNWKKSGMTQKRYDALEKAHKAAALMRKKGTVSTAKRKAVSVSGVTKSVRTAAKGSYSMSKLKPADKSKMRELSAKVKSLTKLKASMKKSGASSKDVRNVTKRINRAVSNLSKMQS